MESVLYRINDYGQQEKIEADFLIVTGLDQKRAIKALEEWEAEQARLAAQAAEEEEAQE